MMEPSGPLPSEIYWRRRWLAIGAAVVALVLLIWIVTALRGGGDDDPTAEAAAASSSLTSTTAASDTTSATESGAADGGESTTESGDDAPSGTAAAAPAGQCADSSLAIKVSADKATYQAGEEPEFGIVVTNIGNASCDRDLGAGMQQVLVYSLDGQQRLWSNNDCYPNSTPDVRTLKPGEQAAFTVKWSGSTSEPGCAAPRTPVGAGAYSVVGQLGNLRSSPEPFNLS
ncbi:hypothetical protein ACFWPA_12665 [Rhodococcus sp. NPDC058505]|uniref:hypothetical protein n=1 Tax=unclassified Rhodococcus (in: high G+C Gram-positive bacteria) TaxID=192944 RepID=UPI00364D2CC3